jgi:hypothetical protein
MPISAKNIFVVKCDRSMFNDTFSRKKSSEIINHHEIRQRLTNNDVFKMPPTDEIINFQIIKRLNNFRECKKTEFLFIYQDEVHLEFINQIKDFFQNSDIPVNYHLLLAEDIKSAKIKKSFNSVRVIDSNWA